MRSLIIRFIILFICFITFSCENEYSRYKIQNEPVFDEKYYLATLRTIEESIKKNPSGAEGYYKKAVVLSKLDKNKEAETAIEKALELEENADFHLLATHLYLENNKPEKGLKAALQAEKAGMSNGWIFSIIADITLQKGDSSTAFSYMEKAISSDPFNPINFINKGKLLLTVKDTSQALEAFHKSLELDSTNVDVYDILTDIYLAKHQYKKAEQFLNRRLINQQPDQKSQIQLAYLLWKTGNYDSARYSFAEILKKEPGDYSAYNYISLIDFQRKKYDSAAWYAEKSLSLKSDAKEAMLTLARIKDINKQYYNALVQYDKIIKLDTSFTVAKEERARIQKKINNLARQNQQERTPSIPEIQQRF